MWSYLCINMGRFWFIDLTNYNTWRTTDACDGIGQVSTVWTRDDGRNAIEFHIAGFPLWKLHHVNMNRTKTKYNLNIGNKPEWGVAAVPAECSRTSILLEYDQHTRSVPAVVVSGYYFSNIELYSIWILKCMVWGNNQTYLNVLLNIRSCDYCI